MDSQPLLLDIHDILTTKPVVLWPLYVYLYCVQVLIITTYYATTISFRLLKLWFYLPLLLLRLYGAGILTILYQLDNLKQPESDASEEFLDIYDDTSPWQPEHAMATAASEVEEEPQKNIPALPVDLLARILGHIVGDTKTIGRFTKVNVNCFLESERFLYQHLVAAHRDDIFYFAEALQGRRERQLLVQSFEVTPYLHLTRDTRTWINHQIDVLTLLPLAESLTLYLHNNAWDNLPTAAQDIERPRLKSVTITSHPLLHYEAVKGFLERHPAILRVCFDHRPAVGRTSQEPEAPPDTPATAFNEGTLPRLEEVEAVHEIVRAMVPDRPVTKVYVNRILPEAPAKLEALWTALGRSGEGVRFLQIHGKQVSSDTIHAIGDNIPTLEQLILTDSDETRVDVSRYMGWAGGFARYKSLHTVRLTFLEGEDVDIIFYADCEQTVLKAWSEWCHQLVEVTFVGGGGESTWTRPGRMGAWERVHFIDPESGVRPMPEVVRPGWP